MRMTLLNSSYEHHYSKNDDVIIAHHHLIKILWEKYTTGYIYSIINFDMKNHLVIRTYRIFTCKDVQFIGSVR